MVNLHPQFIKDADGNRSLVVLQVSEFDALMEELEEMEDIELYDEAKKNDTGERVLFSDYVKNRKSKNAWLYRGIV